MNVSEVYFWEIELSPHKLPMYCAMKARRDVGKAFYIAERVLEAPRRAMGWSTERYESDKDIILHPSKDEVERIVAQSAPDSIHIHSGLHWVPCIVQGQAAAIRHGRHFGVLNEPRVVEGLKGVARLAHSLVTESHLRKHTSFVLAIGRHGPAWFKMSGYSMKKVFPFAYFLENRRDSERKPREAGPPRVAYAGRLEPHKGIRVFLDSLPLIKSDVEIYVAGSGSEEPLVRQKLQDYKGKAVFHGVLPIHDMHRFFEKMDILVLPSITKDDGWGAVVSEALFRGTAVVVSDRVGASVCALDESRGRSIPWGSPEAVARAVDEIIGKGQLTDADRKVRAEWAAGHLSTDFGTSYLMSILDHVFAGAPRPVNFWEA